MAQVPEEILNQAENQDLEQQNNNQQIQQEQQEPQEQQGQQIQQGGVLNVEQDNIVGQDMLNEQNISNQLNFSIDEVLGDTNQYNSTIQNQGVLSLAGSVSSKIDDFYSIQNSLENNILNGLFKDENEKQDVLTQIQEASTKAIGDSVWDYAKYDAEKTLQGLGIDTDTWYGTAAKWGLAIVETPVRWMTQRTYDKANEAVFGYSVYDTQQEYMKKEVKQEIEEVYKGEKSIDDAMDITKEALAESVDIIKEEHKEDFEKAKALDYKIQVINQEIFTDLEKDEDYVAKRKAFNMLYEDEQKLKNGEVTVEELQQKYKGIFKYVPDDPQEFLKTYFVQGLPSLKVELEKKESDVISKKQEELIKYGVEQGIISEDDLVDKKKAVEKVLAFANTYKYGGEAANKVQEMLGQMTVKEEVEKTNNKLNEYRQEIFSDMIDRNLVDTLIKNKKIYDYEKEVAGMIDFFDQKFAPIANAEIWLEKYGDDLLKEDPQLYEELTSKIGTAKKINKNFFEAYKLFVRDKYLGIIPEDAKFDYDYQKKYLSKVVGYQVGDLDTYYGESYGFDNYVDQVVHLKNKAESKVYDGNIIQDSWNYVISSDATELGVNVLRGGYKLADKVLDLNDTWSLVSAGYYPDIYKGKIEKFLGYGNIGLQILGPGGVVGGAIKGAKIGLTVAKGTKYGSKVVNKFAGAYNTSKTKVKDVITKYGSEKAYAALSKTTNIMTKAAYDGIIEDAVIANMISRAGVEMNPEWDPLISAGFSIGFRFFEALWKAKRGGDKVHLSAAKRDVKSNINIAKIAEETGTDKDAITLSLDLLEAYRQAKGEEAFVEQFKAAATRAKVTDYIMYRNLWEQAKKQGDEQMMQHFEKKMQVTAKQAKEIGEAKTLDEVMSASYGTVVPKNIDLATGQKIVGKKVTNVDGNSYIRSTTGDKVGIEMFNKDSRAMGRYKKTLANEVAQEIGTMPKPNKVKELREYTKTASQKVSDKLYNYLMSLPSINALYIGKEDELRKIVKENINANLPKLTKGQIGDFTNAVIDGVRQDIRKQIKNKDIPGDIRKLVVSKQTKNPKYVGLVEARQMFTKQQKSKIEKIKELFAKGVEKFKNDFIGLLKDNTGNWRIKTHVGISRIMGEQFLRELIYMFNVMYGSGLDLYYKKYLQVLGLNDDQIRQLFIKLRQAGVLKKEGDTFIIKGENAYDEFKKAFNEITDGGLNAIATIGYLIGSRLFMKGIDDYDAIYDSFIYMLERFGKDIFKKGGSVPVSLIRAEIDKIFGGLDNVRNYRTEIVDRINKNVVSDSVVSMLDNFVIAGYPKEAAEAVKKYKGTSVNFNTFIFEESKYNAAFVLIDELEKLGVIDILDDVLKITDDKGKRMFTAEDISKMIDDAIEVVNQFEHEYLLRIDELRNKHAEFLKKKQTKNAEKIKKEIERLNSDRFINEYGLVKNSYSRATAAVLQTFLVGKIYNAAVAKELDLGLKKIIKKYSNHDELIEYIKLRRKYVDDIFNKIFDSVSDVNKKELIKREAEIKNIIDSNLDNFNSDVVKYILLDIGIDNVDDISSIVMKSIIINVDKIKSYKDKLSGAYGLYVKDIEDVYRKAMRLYLNEIAKVYKKVYGIEYTEKEIEQFVDVFFDYINKIVPEGSEGLVYFYEQLFKSLNYSGTNFKGFLDVMLNLKELEGVKKTFLYKESTQTKAVNIVKMLLNNYIFVDAKNVNPLATFVHELTHVVNSIVGTGYSYIDNTKNFEVAAKFFEKDYVPQYLTRGSGLDLFLFIKELYKDSDGLTTIQKAKDELLADYMGAVYAGRGGEYFNKFSELYTELTILEDILKRNEPDLERYLYLFAGKELAGERYKEVVKQFNDMYNEVVEGIFGGGTINKFSDDLKRLMGIIKDLNATGKGGFIEEILGEEAELVVKKQTEPVFKNAEVKVEVDDINKINAIEDKKINKVFEDVKKSIGKKISEFIKKLTGYNKKVKNSTGKKMSLNEVINKYGTTLSIKDLLVTGRETEQGLVMGLLSFGSTKGNVTQKSLYDVVNMNKSHKTIFVYEPRDLSIYHNMTQAIKVHGVKINDRGVAEGIVTKAMTLDDLKKKLSNLKSDDAKKEFLNNFNFVFIGNSKGFDSLEGIKIGEKSTLKTYMSYIDATDSPFFIYGLGDGLFITPASKLGEEIYKPFMNIVGKQYNTQVAIKHTMEPIQHYTGTVYFVNPFDYVGNNLAYRLKDIVSAITPYLTGYKYKDIGVQLLKLIDKKYKLGNLYDAYQLLLNYERYAKGVGADIVMVDTDVAFDRLKDILLELYKVKYAGNKELFQKELEDILFDIPALINLTDEEIEQLAKSFTESIDKKNLSKFMGDLASLFIYKNGSIYGIKGFVKKYGTKTMLEKVSDTFGNKMLFKLSEFRMQVLDYFNRKFGIKFNYKRDEGIGRFFDKLYDLIENNKDKLDELLDTMATYSSLLTKGDKLEIQKKLYEIFGDDVGIFYSIYLFNKDKYVKKALNNKTKDIQLNANLVPEAFDEVIYDKGQILSVKEGKIKVFTDNAVGNYKIDKMAGVGEGKSVQIAYEDWDLDNLAMYYLLKDLVEGIENISFRSLGKSRFSLVNSKLFNKFVLKIQNHFNPFLVKENIADVFQTLVSFNTKTGFKYQNTQLIHFGKLKGIIRSNLISMLEYIKGKWGHLDGHELKFLIRDLFAKNIVDAYNSIGYRAGIEDLYKEYKMYDILNISAKAKPEDILKFVFGVDIKSADDIQKLIDGLKKMNDDVIGGRMREFLDDIFNISKTKLYNNAKDLFDDFKEIKDIILSGFKKVLYKRDGNLYFGGFDEIMNSFLYKIEWSAIKLRNLISDGTRQELVQVIRYLGGGLDPKYAEDYLYSAYRALRGIVFDLSETLITKKDKLGMPIDSKTVLDELKRIKYEYDNLKRILQDTDYADAIKMEDKEMREEISNLKKKIKSKGTGLLEIKRVDDKTSFVSVKDFKKIEKKIVNELKNIEPEKILSKIIDEIMGTNGKKLLPDKC